MVNSRVVLKEGWQIPYSVRHPNFESSKGCICLAKSHAVIGSTSIRSLKGRNRIDVPIIRLPVSPRSLLAVSSNFRVCTVQYNGLWAGEFSVRRNGSSSLRKACQVWFREYTSGSRRDQLSLNYSFWKSAALGSPVKVKCMDRGSVLRKFRYGSHRSGTFHRRNIAYRSAKLHTDKPITVL